MILTKKNLYVHMPARMLLEELDEFLAFRLNCEIYIVSEFIDNYSPKDLESIKVNFEKYGLSLSVHGPFMDLNPGSSDKRVRQLSLERFEKALGLSVLLNAKSITLHSHFEPIFYKNHFDVWLKKSKEVWGAVNSESKKKGITIHVENSIDDGPRAVLAILEAYPSFGACFDVAHYNVFYPRGWEDALERYPLGSIKEVHLSDNNGEGDSHMPLGKGSINFKKFFEIIAMRNEKPIFTIEPHSKDGLIESLRFIQPFLN